MLVFAGMLGVGLERAGFGLGSLVSGGAGSCRWDGRGI